MTLPVHDHYVRELTIHALDRRIRLRTAFPKMTSSEVAEVTFEGVEGYVFRGDVLGTILFDIEQVDALTLYREYASEMQRAYSHNGGHAPWAESESAAVAFFSGRDVAGYQLSSSIGLEAAIWARSVTVRALIDADA